MCYIVLSSGKRLDLRKPDGKLFTPEVVAQSLSRIPRFCGHARWPWSVAAHSLLVAELAPPKYIGHALLHDVAEIVTGDIPAPVKKLIWGPELKMLEERIEYAAFGHYGLDADDIAAADAVGDADEEALKIEMACFFGDSQVPTGPSRVVGLLDCARDSFVAYMLLRNKLESLLRADGE